jgi:hypothetical protein
MMKYLLICLSLLCFGCAEQENDASLQLIISTEATWQATAYPSLCVYNGTGPAHFEIEPSDSVRVSMVKGNSWRLMAYTSFPPSESMFSTKPFGSVLILPR